MHVLHTETKTNKIKEKQKGEVEVGGRKWREGGSEHKTLQKVHFKTKTKTNKFKKKKVLLFFF